MTTRHDPACDRQHTARQRCNANLAPHPEHPARLAPEPTPTPIADEATAPAELPLTEAAATDWPPVATPSDAPDPIREHVAAAEVPEPSPFAAREWRRTAAAVGDPPTPAIALEQDAQRERPHAASSAPVRVRPAVMFALFAAAAIVAVVLIVLRGR